MKSVKTKSVKKFNPKSLIVTIDIGKGTPELNARHLLASDVLLADNLSLVTSISSPRISIDICFFLQQTLYLQPTPKRLSYVLKSLVHGVLEQWSIAKNHPLPIQYSSTSILHS